ncbi:MAG: ATP-binding cassette subfamily C protein LapB [Oceanospirillaceae bacterium]|jgi:ATP-binding cassette subfamily C protein LapB
MVKEMDVIQDPLLKCLMHLTQQNHRPLSAQALRNGLPLENNKLTPKLFVRAAKRAGFSAKIVQRELALISPLTLPAVLLLANDDACILQEIDENSGEAILIFPDSGMKRISMDKLAKQYSGVAIYLNLEYHFTERVSRILNEKEGHWFWGTIWRSAKIYRDVLIASFLINVFVLANPLFVMNVYDRVVPNSAIETLWVLAIGVFVAYVFDFGLKMLRAYFLEIAGKKADILMSSMLFEKVMSMQFAHMPKSVGSFASNLREFESIRGFLSSTTTTILIDIPFAIIFLIVLFLIGGPLVYVPLVAMPIILVYSVIASKKLKESVEQTFAASAQKNSTLIECLTAMETVKTQRASSVLQLRWEQAEGFIAKWSLKSKMISSSVTNFAGFVTQVSSVSLVVVGVYLISERELTMGALIAANILSGRVLQPMAQVTGLVTSFFQSKTALNSLNQIMALPDERAEGKNYVHRPSLDGSVEFKGVKFSYPEAEQVSLDKVDFSFKAGEKIALIGRIGSGKSTIEKLLMGLYKPDEGAVRIDGIDLNQIDPVDLRRNIGYVPQELMLFDGSVRDNIIMGSPEIDDSALIKAASISGVDQFINRHPQGFEMQVGERGARLSGGQRQAIAIARALIHEPNILILDEPTNSMDNSSEDYLRKQLAQYSKDRTLVLVTHKMSLLSLVDRIVVMDGGRVVADGPKDVVLDALKQGRLHIQR